MSNNQISISHIQKAVYQLHLAEHLLEVTYPLVKDPKMLLSVLSNLEQAHEEMFKTVLPSNLIKADTDFVSKLKSFEDLLHSQQVITSGEITTIKTVHDLIDKHKESAVVFSRKDSFVICEDDYNLKKIDPLLVGEQVHNTKKLMKKMLDVVENSNKDD